MFENSNNQNNPQSSPDPYSPSVGQPIGQPAQQPVQGIPPQTPNAQPTPVSTPNPYSAQQSTQHIPVNSAQPGWSGNGYPQQQPVATGIPGQPAVEQVYTMPEKFLPHGGNNTGAGHSGGRGALSGKKLALIITCILIVVLGVSAAVVYVLQQRTQPAATPPVNSNTPAVANTANANNANSNANSSNTNNVNTASDFGTPLNSSVNIDLQNNINSGLFPQNNSTSSNGTNTTTNRNTSTTDHSTVADSADTDRDTLTDEEERVYKTTATLPDSDTDGFIDGTEIIKLYSPIKNGQKLLESGLVVEQTNKDFGWSMYYPATWLVEPLGGSQKEILFTPDTIEGEFVEVLVTENVSGQTAADWYASQFTNINAADLKQVTVGGLQGIVTKDGLTYYLADDKYIIGVLYNVGTNDTIHFRTTFTMMVASFKYTQPVVIPAAQPQPAPATTPPTTTNGTPSGTGIAPTTNTNNANSSNTGL